MAQAVSLSRRALLLVVGTTSRYNLLASEAI